MGKLKLNALRKIPISVARLIARNYSYEQVIIYGRRHSDKPREHMTTYGVDKRNCAAAAQMGKVLQRFMGWCGEPTQPNPALAAMEFALSMDDDMDGNTFLRLWRAGDFEMMRLTWENIPDDVFIGVDPHCIKSPRISLRTECLNMIATSRHTGDPIDTERLAAALQKTIG